MPRPVASESPCARAGRHGRISTQGARKALRLFYACGPGDVVTSYRRWKAGEELLSETSKTFSGQFFDLCRSGGHKGYAVSYFHDAAYFRDEAFRVENRPKKGLDSGAWYHLAQARYGLSLIASIVKWRADVAIVDSGTTHWACLAVLKLFGVRVIGSLHNAPWPNGYKPRELVKRMVLAADGWFWRRIAGGLVAISPECERQVRELSGTLEIPTAQHRAQFRQSDFAALPPPSAESRPLRILFAGRVEANKGVLDLVAIAQALEEKRPGEVRFDVCGDGSALGALTTAMRDSGLQGVIRIHGRLARPELLRCYASSHAVIVPTRSDFCEGMPLVCAEAVLSGRPVITSQLSNAADVLPDALMMATPDTPSSYAGAILRLLDEPDLYARLLAACAPLRSQFLDPQRGFAAALAKLLRSPLAPTAARPGAAL